MRLLNDIAAALLVGAGQLAIAFPILRLGERLIVAVRRAEYSSIPYQPDREIPARYIRKPHIPHRTYANRIEPTGPTGPAGRHRLTLANRWRAYRPAVGHIRWHGQPGDVAPRAVTSGIWTEEN